MKCVGLWTLHKYFQCVLTFIFHRKAQPSWPGWIGACAQVGSRGQSSQGGPEYQQVVVLPLRRHPRLANQATARAVQEQQAHLLATRLSRWLFHIVSLVTCSIYSSSYFDYGTEVEIQLPLKRSSRFQRLFPNPSWLVWGRASRHQKLAPTFPGIDSCLLVTKRDFSKWKRHYN